MKAYKDIPTDDEDDKEPVDGAAAAESPTDELAETPKDEEAEGEIDDSVKLSPDFQKKVTALILTATEPELKWIIQEVTEREREMNKAAHKSKMDNNSFNLEGLPD